MFFAVWKCTEARRYCLRCTED